MFFSLAIHSWDVGIGLEVCIKDLNREEYVTRQETWKDPFAFLATFESQQLTALTGLAMLGEV